MLVLKNSCSRPVNLLKINFFTGCYTKLMYLKSRNSLLYLGEPCVGYFRTFLHKSSHNLLIRIWRSNKNKWKYVKRSIFCKFSGFGLQLYYQRAPSKFIRKVNGYTLHNFLRICKATIFRRNSFKYLLHIFTKGKTATQ